MLITLQSYNRLIPKNCENRHFDVEAEVVPFCPMSHRWDKWDKWDKMGTVGGGQHFGATMALMSTFIVIFDSIYIYRPKPKPDI